MKHNAVIAIIHMTVVFMMLRDGGDVLSTRLGQSEAGTVKMPITIQKQIFQGETCHLPRSIWQSYSF